jgi:hypothetical protein
MVKKIKNVAINAFVN